MPLKIALLASGRGSNAKAILDAIDTGELNVQVQCVMSNIEGAPVLDLARTAGLSTHCVPLKGRSREAHEAEMLAVLGQYETDTLVLAGYMRMMTPDFLKAFEGEGHYRIVNIHPSLLPAFPGHHSYEDAFAYGVKVSGVTVHFVDEKMDHGPIILQEAFPRLDNDTLETFRARGLALEHRLYPTALRLIADNRLYFRYNPDTQRTMVEIKAHVPS